MWCTLVYVIATFILRIFASPASFPVIHEKRDSIPTGWRASHKPNASETILLKIALKQSNEDQLYSHLLGISYPDSKNYGQHWTAEKIIEAFAPRRNTVESVTEWLVAGGINVATIVLSGSRGWISFSATVLDAERLLSAEYFGYTHPSGRNRIACTEYSLPAHIQQHVDFITPTLHFNDPATEFIDQATRTVGETKYFPRIRDKKGDVVRRRAKSSEAARPWSPAVPPTTQDLPGHRRALLPLPKRSASPAELQSCVYQITPDCIRALYEIPTSNTSSPGNSLGIIEYGLQSYLPSDLDNFFTVFAPEQVGQRPLLASIDGGSLQNSTRSFQYNSESDLDLEFAMALAYPQNVTLYQVGDAIEGGSFNTFLDAIDSSYCTYEGGDDSSEDPEYPDANPNGYRSDKSCGGFTPADVLSTSYGYNEADLTPAYMTRQCNEYAKLGLMGITVLYSSMDYGVAGSTDQCIDPATGHLNNGTYGLFSPSFPSTCPFVTSVGATQIAPGGTVYTPEQACETVTYSGGGFSNVFGIPAYQTQTQQTFFAEHAPSYGAERYNATQQSRAYPDISANGANYVVNVDGVFRFIYGTSAATPVLGAIFTQINDARLAAGKGPVGFVNPTLYAHPEVLNDITLGSNPGCGTRGFNATEGWDPVTGLGTPNFPKMLDLFMNLP